MSLQFRERDENVVFRQLICQFKVFNQSIFVIFIDFCSDKIDDLRLCFLRDGGQARQTRDGCGGADAWSVSETNGARLRFLHFFDDGFQDSGMGRDGQFGLCGRDKIWFQKHTLARLDKSRYAAKWFQYGLYGFADGCGIVIAIQQGDADNWFIWHGNGSARLFSTRRRFPVFVHDVKRSFQDKQDNCRQYITNKEDK